MVVGLVGCLGIGVVAGYATYRIWAQGQRDDQRPADAIVVMGAAQYDGRPSPLLRRAAGSRRSRLYKAGVAGSGGPDRDRRQGRRRPDDRGRHPPGRAIAGASRQAAS